MIAKRKYSFLISALSIALLISSVSASDVAYIYKNKIDANIIKFFSDSKLTYDLIKENSIPKNFSDYKLIFIGDENFAEEIPINKYPSIVMNYYKGPEWGITDKDGISKLASISPLNVKFNGKLLQVYTTTKDSRGDTLAYYYLDQNNKAKSLKKYAGTYSTGSGADFGDVISFAKKGDTLNNKKTANENICFFGIIKTDYWTNNSKELFKNCIRHVYDFTLYPKIKCFNDSDCGKSISGNAFCSDKIIFQNNLVFKCINSGKETSYCSNETIVTQIQTCSDFCFEGDCRNFVCKNNSDCNDNNAKTEDACLSPGTSESLCEHKIIVCFADSDCNNNNSSTKDVCIDKGTSKSKCTHTLIPAPIQINCSVNSDCNDNNPKTEDTCANPGIQQSYCTHNEIKCFENADCNDNNINTEDICANKKTGNSNCVYYSNITKTQLISLTAIPNTNSVTLKFSATPKNGSSVKEYLVAINKSNWISITHPNSEYNFTNLTSSTYYIFFAKALDNSNQASDEINISIKTLDIPTTSEMPISPPSNQGGGSGGGASATSTSSEGIGTPGTWVMCVTQWNCNSWSECKNGKQTRSCSYPAGSCRPEREKPIESQSCIETPEIKEEISQTPLQKEEPVKNKKWYSPITGAFLGARNKYSLIGIFAFLVIIIALSIYLRIKK